MRSIYLHPKSLRRAWRSRLLTVAALLIAGVAATFTSGGHLRGQTPATQRVFIVGQNETDPVLTVLASDLQKRGFTVFRDPGSLPSLMTGTTTAIVLSPQTFYDAEPDLLRSLYQQGVVIAAINVTVPDLAAVLEPDGPSRPPMPGLLLSTPDPSQWLPTSSRYTLYAIMSLSSKTAMPLTSVDAFVDLIERRESGHAVLHATPPAPFAPGPVQAPATSSTPLTPFAGS